MHSISVTRRLAALPLAAVLLASVSAPALALDGDDFVTKLNAAYAGFNASIEYDSVVTEDDAVTIAGAKFVSPGQPPLDVGEILFEGIEETDDGGYLVESASIPGIDYQSDDVRFVMDGVTLAGLVVPAKVEPGTLESLLFYDSFSAGRMAVSVKGAEAFAIESIEGEATRRDGDTGMDFTLDGEGIVANLGLVEEAKARETIKKLGYETLKGKLHLDLGWDLVAGRLELREYSFDFADVGKLDMRLDISGYTLEFLKAMQETQAAAAANPDPQAAQTATNIAMLGLIQQLTFNGASIRFDDASLTGRALKVAGEQQGVTGDQMKDAMKGMLPLMLGQINIPALQQQIVAAANAFLDDPKSITVSAKPASPVAVPMIMGAAQNPQQMVELLNVTVTANE